METQTIISLSNLPDTMLILFIGKYLNYIQNISLPRILQKISKATCDRGMFAG